jgi:stage IV sporulation protein FB
VNAATSGGTPQPPGKPARPVRASGQQGLRFNLFGFPTRIDASFLLIVALIGFDGNAAHVGIWVGLALVSVLGHELGHALAARRLGATASITLAGLGGLTASRRAEPLRRGESAFLTAAGPLAGIVLGLPVLWALHTTGWSAWTTGGYVLRTAAFTTLGWSALNLLPILPLDGGHLLELALPGAPAARRATAARVSIAIAAVAAVVAFRAGLGFSAVLAVMFAAQNLAALRAQPPVVPDVPVEPTPGGGSMPGGLPGGSQPPKSSTVVQSSASDSWRSPSPEG